MIRNHTMRDRLTRLVRALAWLFTNKWVNRVVFVAVLAYLVNYVATKTEAADFRSIEIDPVWALLSMLFTVAYLFLYAIIWQWITRLLDIAFPLRKGLAIWAYSNLGKYVPLKVAKYGYRVSLYCLGTSFTPQRVMKASYVETLASILGGLVIFLLLLPVQAFEHPLINVSAALIALVGLGGILLITSSRRFDDLAYKLLKISLLSRNISKTRQLKIIATYGAAWLVAGIAFYCAVRAIAPEQPAITVLNATFFFAFGGIVGIISLFAPSGIGVREGILLAFLTPFFSLPEATAMVILSRVIIVVAEFAGVTYGFIFLQAEKSHAQAE